MPSTTKNNQANPAEFSLKHRLIGAGILISFGVIILPWMLGSYSTAESEVEVAQEDERVKPSSIAALATKAASKTTQSDDQADNEEDKEVSVFISRVQPLNRDDNEPAIDDSKKQTQSEIKAEVDSKQEEKPTTAEKPTTPKEEQKTVAESAKDTAKAEEKIEPKKAEQASTDAGTSVSRGYIVSIGVYGDATNVEKMVADLKSKQFEPVVRKEKFNEKDVSRVYLGPFQTRAEAGKVKLSLSEKGIQKTLIKEFP